METLKKSNFPPFLFECWGDWKEREGVSSGKIRAELFNYIQNIGYRIININGFPDMYIAEFNRL